MAEALGSSTTSDREALLALYWSSGGPRWKNQQGWAENSPDLSSWNGVGVNDEGRVVMLDLQNNTMEGTIPPAVGRLRRLTCVKLSHNGLTGPIPAMLGDLSSLSYLDIGFNKLTGGFPPELGKLKELSKIDLSCNQLTGVLPPELGDMVALLTCWLEKNQFEGPIPAEIAQILHLSDFDLSGNRVEEGRLQGATLLAWKNESKRRLSEASQGVRGFSAGPSVSNLEAFQGQLLAKDDTIASLKAQISALKSARQNTGRAMKSFFSR